MPKRVDHEVRRRQIAAGVWRIAAERGLPAATLREVAAESEVSMRLVQYYFTTKHQMLVYAFELAAVTAGERMRSRFGELGRTPEPVEVVRICLHELLPTDPDSLLLSRVHAAYYAAALTDATLTAADADNPQHMLENLIAGQLRAGQARDLVPAAIDPDLEARGLAALAAGLSSIVLVGGRTPEEALATIDYQIDRLFPGQTA
ncbi:TetR/AcrR family transcriptional regulator [Actinoplanes palleronii]|nr:TetR/AcrR family transcriptional regulator [Actinoplanes palleronii]